MLDVKISLDQIKRNAEVVAFLDKIPRIKRMVVLKPLANKYRGDGDPHEYMRRLRRTIVTDLEIAEILDSAAIEGFTLDGVREAEKQARQFKERVHETV